MEPITFTVDQLTSWAVNGYIWAHLLFGVVTHYHSALEVRKYNREQGEGYNKVGSLVTMGYFIVRMCAGLPWFVISRVVAPIGNKWHMTAEEIKAAW